MVNVWIVQGNSNARKSSSIRCLTGIGNSTDKPWAVAALNGTFEAHVTPSALQENPKQGYPNAPDEYIRFICGAGFENVIVALRINGARGHPGADAYYKAFVAAGWTIAGVVTLGPSSGPPAIATPHQFPNSPSDPANLTASHIRRLWNWI